MTEERILTSDPEHTLIGNTDGESITGEVVIIDGPIEKSAVRLSTWAGASSTASAASGVPSAQTQHGVKQYPNEESGSTAIADRIEEGSHVGDG